MTERCNASNSGSGETPQQKRLRRASCVHHWILENTTYPIVKGSGQSNMGTTKAHCKKCGKNRRATAATPDSIHGMESLIASNIREGELPEGFDLEGEGHDG